MINFKKLGVTLGISTIAAMSIATTVCAKSRTDYVDCCSSKSYYYSSYDETDEIDTSYDKYRPYSVFKNGYEVDDAIEYDKAEQILDYATIWVAEENFEDDALIEYANEYLDEGEYIYDIDFLASNNLFNVFSNEKQDRIFNNGFVAIDDFADASGIKVVCKCSLQEYYEFKDLVKNKHLANVSLYGYNSSDDHSITYDYKNQILTYTEEFNY